MITLRMGAERALLPGDPIGRSVMGWTPGLSPRECWTRTRGLWLLDERRVLAEDTVLVVDPNWIIRAEVQITGITKHGNKRAIEGVVLPGTGGPGSGEPLELPGSRAGSAGTSAVPARVGMPCPVRNDSRNSVAYWPGVR